MNGVRSGLDAHVRCDARPPAIFRLVLKIHADFLNRVRRKKARAITVAAVGVDDVTGSSHAAAKNAFEEIVVAVRTHAVARVPFEPPPGLDVTPGVNCRSCSQFRPITGRSLMSLLSITPPKVALVVLISGSASVTVTVCTCEPALSTMSTRMSPPTLTGTSLRSSELNPLDSTFTVYWPGIKLGAAYAPFDRWSENEWCPVPGQ